MRSVVLAIIGLVLTIGVASATVPDPDLCAVDPCDLFQGMVTYPDPIPGGAAEFTANVRNADNDPIPDAFVEVIFGTPGNHYFCEAVVLTGTTDTNGDVTFNISAGGCTIDPLAVKIRANGVDIRTYGTVKSPDFLPVDGRVEIADFIGFSTAYAASAPGCTDFFNDGATELGDFIFFSEAWGKKCPELP